MGRTHTSRVGEYETWDSGYRMSKASFKSRPAIVMNGFVRRTC